MKVSAFYFDEKYIQHIACESFIASYKGRNVHENAVTGATAFLQTQFVFNALSMDEDGCV